MGGKNQTTFGDFDMSLVGIQGFWPRGSFQDVFLSSLRSLVTIFGNTLGPVFAGCKHHLIVL